MPYSQLSHPLSPMRDLHHHPILVHFINTANSSSIYMIRDNRTTGEKIEDDIKSLPAIPSLPPAFQ